MPKNPYSARYWVRDYFTFTRWQRRALMILMLLLLLAAAAPYAVQRWWREPSTPAEPVVLQQVEELMAWEQRDSSGEDHDHFRTSWREPKRDEVGPPPVYTLFDPNTAPPEQWLRFGLTQKTVQTIMNYRASGGRFRQPQDLLKIYGLPRQKAMELIPYVAVSAAATPASLPRRDSFPAVAATRPPVRTPVLIDINLADTSQWIALPGVGSKLAGRIVQFRDKLGGFYNVSQVAETYGLPDSTFQKIQSRLRVNPTQIRRININTVTADELKAHPYFRWNVATAVVNYRRQHGPFSSAEDLLQIAILDEAWLKKVQPYLVIQ